MSFCVPNYKSSETNRCCPTTDGQYEHKIRNFCAILPVRVCFGYLGHRNSNSSKTPLPSPAIEHCSPVNQGSCDRFCKVSNVHDQEQDDYDEDVHDRRRLMTSQEVWAREVQRTWNKILHVDAKSGMPRTSLPGFPIEVGRGAFFRTLIVRSFSCEVLSRYWRFRMILSFMCRPIRYIIRCRFVLWSI